MVPVNYRIAAKADAALLAALGARAFTETFGHLYHPDDLAAFLENHTEARWQDELSNPDFTVQIAEADGEAAAYAKIGPPSLPLKPRGPSIELRQLYVLKPWQGAGVAHDLMNWVIDEARARGADDLYLSVFIENHRARRFYERYGFEFIGTYAFRVGNHVDEDHVMRLSLKQ